MSTSSEHYKRLKSNPNQPKRSIEDLRRLANKELERHGLHKELRVVITENFPHPKAVGSCMPLKKIIKLHPVNQFAIASDVRATVRHEGTHYKDHLRGTKRARC